MAITALPTAPSRSRPAEFSDEADAFVAALPTFGTEANALAVECNGYATDAASDASLASDSEIAAEAAKDAALAAANFEGNWSDLIGALNTPASCLHLGSYWMLLENLADVTTDEPGTSTKWDEITRNQPTLNLYAHEMFGGL